MENVKTKEQSITEFVIEQANRINEVVGAPGWQTVAEERTTEVINGITNKEECIQALFDFMSIARAFDQTQVVSFLIRYCSNVELIKLVELCIFTPTVESTSTIIEGLIELINRKNCTSDDKEKATIDAVICNYVKLTVTVVATLDIERFSEFLIQLGDTNLIQIALNKYPYHHMAQEETFELMLDKLLEKKDWKVYADFSVNYPGLLDIYDSKYQIKEMLSNEEEETKPIIREWVNVIYNEYAMDINFHTSIMRNFNNQTLNHAFHDLAMASFEALAEFKMEDIMQGEQVDEG